MRQGVKKWFQTATQTININLILGKTPATISHVGQHLIIRSISQTKEPNTKDCPLMFVTDKELIQESNSQSQQSTIRANAILSPFFGLPFISTSKTRTNVTVPSYIKTILLWCMIYIFSDYLVLLAELIYQHNFERITGFMGLNNCDWSVLLRRSPSKRHRLITETDESSHFQFRVLDLVNTWSKDPSGCSTRSAVAGVQPSRNIPPESGYSCSPTHKYQGYRLHRIRYSLEVTGIHSCLLFVLSGRCGIYISGYIVQVLRSLKEALYMVDAGGNTAFHHVDCWWSVQRWWTWRWQFYVAGAASLLHHAKHL